MQNRDERIRKKAASQAINRTLSDFADALGIDVPPGSTPTERRERLSDILRGMQRQRDNATLISFTGALGWGGEYAAHCKFTLNRVATVLILLGIIYNSSQNRLLSQLVLAKIVA